MEFPENDCLFKVLKAIYNIGQHYRHDPISEPQLVHRVRSVTFFHPARISSDLHFLQENAPGWISKQRLLTGEYGYVFDYQDMNHVTDNFENKDLHLPGCTCFEPKLSKEEEAERWTGLGHVTELWRQYQAFKELNAEPDDFSLKADKTVREILTRQGRNIPPSPPRKQELELRDGLLASLKGINEYAGKRVCSEEVSKDAFRTLKEMIYMSDDQLRSSSARTLGFISQYLKEEMLFSVLEEIPVKALSSKWADKHGSLLTFSSMLKHIPSTISASPSFTAVVNCLKDCLKDTQESIRALCAKVLGRLLLHQVKNEPDNTDSLQYVLASLVSAMQDDFSQVRRIALVSLEGVAREHLLVIKAHAAVYSSVVASCLTDARESVRAVAESCAYALELSEGSETVHNAKRLKLSEVSDDSDSDETAYHPIPFSLMDTIFAIQPIAESAPGSPFTINQVVDGHVSNDSEMIKKDIEVLLNKIPSCIFKKEDQDNGNFLYYWVEGNDVTKACYLLCEQGAL